MLFRIPTNSIKGELLEERCPMYTCTENVEVASFSQLTQRGVEYLFGSFSEKNERIPSNLILKTLMKRCLGIVV